jgi:hypothetical protein
MKAQKNSSRYLYFREISIGVHLECIEQADQEENLKKENNERENQVLIEVDPTRKDVSQDIKTVSRD